MTAPTTHHHSPLYFPKVAILGCGLMGGSFALALKQAGLAGKITGFSASVATLDTAKAMGVIDQACFSAAEACVNADLIVLGVPVAAMGSTFAAFAPKVLEQTLVIDVGSTKQSVIDEARTHLGDKVTHFVPCHPIAGKEKAGVAHSDATLFQGKRCIITPTAHTTIKRINQARALWEALGSEVVTMSAPAHDKMFAAVSHLPHFLAFVLMHAITSQSEGEEFLAMAGTGFRDATRIAASDAKIWRDILHTNTPEVRAQLAFLRRSLDAFDDALETPAALEVLIEQASQTRRAMRFDAPYQQDETSK